MPATDLAHPEEDRPLSIEEYKRLQEFPDDWKVAGSLIEQYRQIGNAVPISLGLAIGKLIHHLLQNNECNDINDTMTFKFSRYHNTSDEDWMKKFKKLIDSKLFSQQVLF